jgi:hypothetical protein
MGKVYSRVARASCFPSARAAVVRVDDGLFETKELSLSDTSWVYRSSYSCI